MYLARKYLLRTLFLRLPMEMGAPFYVVMRGTQKSSRLKDKGSTFISQLY